MFSKLALGGIWTYQQYISPKKGFRCAYSVAHGGTGCSGFAKHAIRDHGLWRALPAIRQRFRDCRAAYEDIRTNCSCNTSAPDDAQDDQPISEAERKELLRRRKRELRKRDRRSRDRCCDTCDCFGSACAPSPLGYFGGCFGGAARGGASKSLDLNPCDGDGCGVDCGSADCFACDCGGCSCG